MKFKSSQVTVSPKKAEEYLSHNTYAGQRHISPRHIQELQAKMNDGRFHVGNIAIVYNGSPILADGQHQCHAGIIAGRPFKALLQEYTIEEADSKEDIARVFSQFNVDRARSRGDIAWIHGCQIGMDKWPRRCVTLCNTAIGWMESGFGLKAYIALSKDENAALLAKYRKQCEFIYELLFCNEQRSRHLLRSPVTAAMMQTFIKSRSDAEVFWAAVRDGDMLKRGEPTFVLRDYLLRVSVSVGAGARQTGKESVGFRELYVKCIHAWNAYRGGETQLRLVRFNPKHALPKVK